MGKPWYMALTQLAGLWRSSGAIPQALIRGQQSLSAALEGSGSPHWLAWLRTPRRARLLLVLVVIAATREPWEDEDEE